MPRIRTIAERDADRREALAAVARALLEAEPATANHTISLHVARHGEQLPRIPAVGLHPGAIRGTSPHHARIHT